MNNIDLPDEPRQKMPHKTTRYIFFMLIGYIVVIGAGVYYLIGFSSMVSSVSCAVFSLFSLILTKRIIQNLLFEKNNLFYILLSFLKFIIIVLAVWLAIFVFKFDLTGMMIGFSVVPITVVTLVLFPNILNS